MECRHYHVPKYTQKSQISLFVGHWTFSFVARALYSRSKLRPRARWCNRRREVSETEVKSRDSPVINDEKGRENKRAIRQPPVFPIRRTFRRFYRIPTRNFGRTREYVARLSTAGGLDDDLSCETADEVILISAMPAACGSKLRAIVDHPRLHALYS